MQSTLDAATRGLHVAIIMDGNGRWAAVRGKPRTAGHRAGAKAVRRTVEAAPGLSIGTLTLYAFSSDNWKRPPDEVATLMRLFRDYLRGQTARCVEKGVDLRVIGRRDRLPDDVLAAVRAAEESTAGGSTLVLRLAVDYSARDAIAAAAELLAREGARSGAEGDVREALSGHLDPEHPGAGAARDVDLLIRTGGEQRLSDFLLWECAYAELYFTPVMWPDFGAEQLEAALAEFRRRERRFGGLARVATG
jgi:undecaprenyl diphosphate synthase